MNEQNNTRRIQSRSRLVVHNHRNSALTQEEILINYFNSKIDVSTTLNKVTLICYDKNAIDTQIILSFVPDSEGVLFNCRLINCVNYIKTTENFFKISPYGHLSQLLSKLILYIMKQNIPIKEKKIICVKMDIISPNNLLRNVTINDSVEITIDKTEEGALVNNECPVCLSSFKQKERITLKCFHKICRDCLFSSLENKLYTCPICRGELLPNINNNDNESI